METSNLKKAEILVQALPYIQQYKGQIVVVKFGGNALNDSEITKGVMADIALLSHIGVKMVLVHGGSLEVNSFLDKQGFYSNIIDGVRSVDAGTAVITQMILAGKVNKSLVVKLQAQGGKAIGISGADGALLVAEKVSEMTGYVGKIKKVNTQVVFDVLDKGYIPVISTVGHDGDGNVYDINADEVAATLAYEMKAYSLISLTDTNGVLKDKNNDATKISVLNVSDVPILIKDNVISGGMVPKVKYCVDAVRRGVKKVFIIDGRAPHSLLVEMLSDEGVGTMLV